MKNIASSIRIFFTLTLLTGVVYPAAVYLGGRLFADKADGSLIYMEGKIVGSSLLAQKFTRGIYFHPRPSACDYSAAASCASNLGPTSAVLKKVVDERRSALIADTGGNPPSELLHASGSGLDPHIGPGAALYQIDRIVRERKLRSNDAARLRTLISRMTEGPAFGFMGRPRINVLMLNIELDREFPVE